LKYFRDGAPIMDMVAGQAGKFQYGRAHVGVIGPGVATDSNTIDLSYSPHHALHAADGTTPQKTAVYPRIIPRTGQFGTVSELKPSHTLHASRLKPMANMPHYFKATPLGCRCMAANASDDLASGSYRRICMATDLSLLLLDVTTSGDEGGFAVDTVKRIGT
jgi:hypothetical protein